MTSPYPSDEIGQLPSMGAGSSFSYAAWTPGTSAMLCRVPWGCDYRDVVQFADTAALDTYLSRNAGETITIGKLTYCRAGEPIRVNIPFNAAYSYNYLRVSNPVQPVTGTLDSGASYHETSPLVLYYFIVDVRYLAPNTTELLVQLDVFQTFGKRVKFGNCYVERGHIGIANENQFADHGREYLTVPEGLDMGNEYVITDNSLFTLVDIYDPNNQPDIVITTTVSLLGDWGTATAPILTSARGSTAEGLPSGCEVWAILSDKDGSALSKFKILAQGLSQCPWIAQGIVSIMLVPSLTRLGRTSIDYDTIEAITSLPGVDNFFLYSMHNPAHPPTMPVVMGGKTWRQDRMPLPSRYAHLHKFRTFPYSSVELTTFSGTPIVLKPECIATDDFTVDVLSHVIQPSPRIMVVPRAYNAAEGRPVGESSGEFMDLATGITDLPTFSLVNNSYLSYIASNRNSIAYQHTSADWSQQRALTGNQLSYNQSSAGIALQNSLTQMGIGAANQTTSLQNSMAGWRAAQQAVGTAVNSAAGGVTGVGVGAVMGLVNGAVSYGIETHQNTAQNNINNSLRASQNAAQVGQSSYVRDTNKSYSDYAANGDYQNSIAAINAKVQDAKLIQPTTSGQVGGDAFNLAVYRWAIIARTRMLQAAAMSMIGDYWLRYGYAINRFTSMPDDYMVMSKFTYWKLRESYVTSGSCPELFKQTMRGIFEKGVTVWANPDDIGAIDLADNLPLQGVTL